MLWESLMRCPRRPRHASGVARRAARKVVGEGYCAEQTLPAILAGLVRFTHCVPLKWTDYFECSEAFCERSCRELAAFLAAVLVAEETRRHRYFAYLITPSCARDERVPIEMIPAKKRLSIPFCGKPYLRCLRSEQH